MVACAVPVMAGKTIRLNVGVDFGEQIWAASRLSTSSPERISIASGARRPRGAVLAVRSTRPMPLDEMRLYYTDVTGAERSEDIVLHPRDRLPVSRWIGVTARGYGEFVAALVRARSLMVLNYDFHSLKGHHQTVVAAVAAGRTCGVRCAVIRGAHLEYLPGASALVSHAVVNTPMLVNGLHCFEYRRAREIIRKSSRAPVVYLQEGRVQLESFLRDNRDEGSAALDLLKSCELIASSDAQRRSLKAVGMDAETVVYNCAPFAFTRLAGELRAARATAKHDGRTQIVMVGTLQPRKGPDLFDAVAAQLPEMDFRWLGPGDSNQLRYARHLGAGTPNDALRLMAAADVLFISSRDDPLPLCAVEALSVGGRVVCGTWIVTAEIVDGLAGCATFNRYEVAAAVEAIESALAARFDQSAAEPRIADF